MARTATFLLRRDSSNCGSGSRSCRRNSRACSTPLDDGVVSGVGPSTIPSQPRLPAVVAPAAIHGIAARVDSSGGFAPPEITYLTQLVVDHREELLRAWHDFFTD